MDDTTLAAWASLLGLTEQQTADTLTHIEETLRVGYEHRPESLREASFEQLTKDMDAEQAALMFLISGLRRAGYPGAAQEIEIRGIVATLRDLNRAD
ncbi:hypothetical protein [Streptomyces jumonjinensis]|uniref:MafI family immunity protein n=1 Tax=Streptomyces jumonjinensis TaxID=1945 RepID=A0A646KT29_STRJU|nr:hypothetical protein [Streptomyces jumonjinensis]MQT05454.1 hypothetical protein [Streptomyces jumonjinensis]